MYQRSIQVKFFPVDQNVGKSLKYIFIKIELSTPSRFQDIAFKNKGCFSYFTVAILPAL